VWENGSRNSDGFAGPDSDRNLFSNRKRTFENENQPAAAKAPDQTQVSRQTLSLRSTDLNPADAGVVD
jgi:hypothetical protein